LRLRLLALVVLALAPHAAAQTAWEDEPHPPVPPMLDAPAVGASDVTYRFPGLDVTSTFQMKRDGAKILRLTIAGVEGAPPFLDLRCGDRSSELEQFFVDLKDASFNLIVHVKLDPPGELPRTCVLEPAHVTDLLDVYHSRRPFGFTEERMFEYAKWEGRLYARDASKVSLLLRTFWCDKGVLMCRSIGEHYDAPYFRETFVRFQAILSAPDSKDGRYLKTVRELYQLGRTKANGEKEGGPELRLYRDRQLVGAHRTYPSKEQNDVAAGWGVRVSYAEALARYTMWRGTPEKPYSTEQKDFDLYVAYFIANGVVDRYLERLAGSSADDATRADVLQTVERLKAAPAQSEDWRRTFVALSGGDPTAPLPGRTSAAKWLAYGGAVVAIAAVVAVARRRRRAPA
jgi:hypothetical protein